MPDYIVTKKEQYLQQVLVTGAKNKEDAIEKASNGQCTIQNDAQYDSDVASSSWEAEKCK